MTDEEKRALEESALKRATGYESVETQEEYSLVDGDMALVKRKVIKKDVAPDLGAIKWLLGESGGESVSLEELEREREELERNYFSLLEKENSQGTNSS